MYKNTANNHVRYNVIPVIIDVFWPIGAAEQAENNIDLLSHYTVDMAHMLANCFIQSCFWPPAKYKFNILSTFISDFASFVCVPFGAGQVVCAAGL